VRDSFALSFISWHLAGYIGSVRSGTVPWTAYSIGLYGLQSSLSLDFVAGLW